MRKDIKKMLKVEPQSGEKCGVGVSVLWVCGTLWGFWVLVGVLGSDGFWWVLVGSGGDWFF